MRSTTSAGPTSRAYTRLCLVFAVLAFIAFRASILALPTEWWLFQGVFIAVAGFFLVWHLSAHGDDPLHPLVAMIALLYLYATGSALYVREKGCTYFGVAVSAELLNEFYLCCLLGLTGLVMGAWVGHSLSPGRANLQSARPGWLVSDHAYWRKMVFYGLLLAIPVLPAVLAQFDPTTVRPYCETVFESRVRANSNPVQVVWGVLAAIPAQFLFAAAVLAMLKWRNVLWRTAAAAVVAAYALVPLLGGYRGTTLIVGTIVLAIYHYRVRRLGFRTFVVGLLLGYLFLTGMTIARRTNDPLKMFHIFVAEFTEGEGKAFSIERSRELWTAQNLMAQMQYIDEGRTSFTYGVSLFTDLLVFIPRAVFEDRPLSSAQQFAELVSPGSTAQGKGYGLFILQEGYWICGLPGVFASMFYLGWLLEGLYLWFARRMQYDVAVLCYGCILSVCAASIRGGIVIQIKAALMLILPFIILGYLPFFTRHPKAQRRADIAAPPPGGRIAPKLGGF